MNITYYKGVSVTVFIHGAMRVRRFIFSYVSFLVLPYFFTLSYKGRIFQKKSY
jgi:hypothetical protein